MSPERGDITWDGGVQSRTCAQLWASAGHVVAGSA